MASKSELRRKLAAEVAKYERPPQTHSVFVGKLRYPAYQDGDVMRSLVSGEVLARRTKKGWTQKVVTAVPLRGEYDDIKPINKEPVEVTLDKGTYY